MDEYPIENDWVGEHDNDPPCFYNLRVGCKHQRCIICGWNPFVAMDRIKTEYGAAAVDYLTMNN